MVFTPAFFGFLFTTFPKFSQTEPIERVVYITIFIPFALGSLFFLIGSSISQALVSFSIIFILIGHILGVNILRKIYRRASFVRDKFDILWILIFMSSGALSNLIFYIGYIFNNSTLIESSVRIAYIYISLW